MKHPASQFLRVVQHQPLKAISVLGLFLSVVCCCSEGAAFEAVPPADDLIRQAEAAHDRYTAESSKEDLFYLMAIAEAKAWQGDIDGALQSARKRDGRIEDLTASACVVIHLERTGEIRELPESVFDEWNGIRIGHLQHRLELAKKLDTLDRKDEALTFLPPDDVGVLSLLYRIEFQLAAGKYDLQKERATEAGQHFQQAVSLLNRKSGNHHPIVEGSLRAARGLLASGDQRGAEQCLNDFHGKLKATLQPQAIEKVKKDSRAGMWLARSCATLGTISSLLGDSVRADHEFQLAHRILAQSGEAESRPPDDHDILDLHETAIDIALWQHDAGFRKECAAAIRQVVEDSSSIMEASTRYGLLEIAVEAFCETGNSASAAAVTERIEDDYWKNRALCRLAVSEHNHDDGESAATLFKEARKLCLKPRQPFVSAWMWDDLAKALAATGDDNAAQQAFQQLLTLPDDSESHETRRSACLSQIRLGYLSDAWVTLQPVTNPKTRSFLLAKLALAVAKPRQ